MVLRLAQAGFLAAVEQLQRGDEELHLADAARAPASRRSRGRLAAQVNLHLEIAERLHRRQVEAPPPDEGPEFLEQLLSQREVSRHRPRLDQAARSQVRPNVARSTAASTGSELTAAPARPWGRRSRSTRKQKPSSVTGGHGPGERLGEAGVILTVGTDPAVPPWSCRPLGTLA